VKYLGRKESFIKSFNDFKFNVTLLTFHETHFSKLRPPSCVPIDTLRVLASPDGSHPLSFQNTVFVMIWDVKPFLNGS